jgi:NAD(P)-dependent dehydrogenase (short-subunit alcohol dehydrogenase family)
MMLDGRVAIVTGAASGIGRATALRMAAEGARVVCADRDGEGAARVAAEIGRHAAHCAVDVTQDAECAAMVALALERFGALHCAFNNAGVAPVKAQPMAEIEPEEFARVMGVNLMGVFLCLRHQVPAMTAGGAIVNTASVAGRVGLPGAAAYVASKHAVIGLTKNAALDHAAQGIRVNAVCPGYVQTPLAERGIDRRRDTIIARVPQARIGRPDEIAALVTWLCSDQASFVTGEAVTADGGYMAN